MLSHRHSSIVPFVYAFGKDPSNTNIILEYSKIFAEVSDLYDSGMGLYMLEHMNHAVLSGQGAVAMRVGHHSYVMDNSVLGLQSLPTYMKRLKVSIMSYSDAQHRIDKLNSNADTYAAMQFIKGKHAKAYTSFLDREIARVDAMRLAHDKAHADAAYGAEVNAYNDAVQTNAHAPLVHVNVQTPAGIQAAKTATDADTWVVPTMEQIKASARAAAAAYMKQLHIKLSDTASIIKNQEQHNMGVTIIMTSNEDEDGESSQTPTVIVKGTKGTITGTLSSLPLPGQSLSQTFPSDHLLGDLKSVEIKASSNDAWLCKSFAVKVGELPEVAMQQTNFWLEAVGTTGVEHASHPFAALWELTPA